jgi:hypothetical protein
MAEGRKTGGRKRGTPNKVTGELKSAILAALEEAGGKRGGVGYLKDLAASHPTAFASLLGRVLPLQVSGDPENPLQHSVKVSFG